MRRNGRAFAVAALLAAPSPALAHLASTGLGPLYDGAWHLLLTPGQLVPLGIAALSAGRRGPAAARWSFLLLPPVWLAAWCTAAVLSWAGGVAMLVAGVLLATDRPRHPVAAVAAALAVGALAGAAYDAPTAPANALGTLALLLIVLALAASVSLPLRRWPAALALRVAGSWSAALGLLLIGWWLHGHTA